MLSWLFAEVCRMVVRCVIGKEHTNCTVILLYEYFPVRVYEYLSVLW